MKRHVTLSLAAVLVLVGAGAAMADEQKAAANSPAATAAAPATQPEAAKAPQTAEATKPAAPEAAKTEATATKAAPTTAPAVQEVRFKVTGFTNQADADALQTKLAKAPGVSNAKVDYATGLVTARTEKTGADLCSWVKINNPNLNCTPAKY